MLVVGAENKLMRKLMSGSICGGTVNVSGRDPASRFKDEGVRCGRNWEALGVSQ